MTLIDERPKETETREIPGRWEDDLIIGENHKSAICVTAERTTYYVRLGLLKRYDALAVRKTIEHRFNLYRTYTRIIYEHLLEHLAFQTSTLVKLF